MNYERKYKESLERARKIENREPIDVPDGTSIPVAIFPELYESEEEKLRKEMLQIAKESEDSFYMVLTPKKKEMLISLLEKQGQQKEINLDKILKHYPRETELYSPLYGKLWLAEVDEVFGIITCYKHPLDEGCTRAILKQEDTVSFYSDGTTRLPDFSVSDECMLFLYDSEKQGEQKTFNYESANIQQKDFAYVEPKFRIEAKKWYICISQYGNCIEGRWYQALSDGRITNDFGTEYDMHSDADKYFRPWNIKDVKDGNVLYSPGHNLLWIYKNKNTYHVSANLNYPHHISVFDNIAIPSDVCPASKEQCDILFARLKKFGYTWDKDTKKLIKL